MLDSIPSTISSIVHPMCSASSRGVGERPSDWVSSDDGPPSLLDTLGVDDHNLEHVEIRESIKPLLEGLDPREKRILLLRFCQNMTQSQIAEEIGVSQMHVSRLLTKTLKQLRTSLEVD